MAKKSSQENYLQKQPEWLNLYENVGTMLISKSLFDKYLEYLFEIDELIRNNEPIPAKLAKRFFALHQTDTNIAAKRNRIAIRNKSKMAIEKTMAYFENREGYLFSGKSLQLVYKPFDIFSIWGNENQSILGTTNTELAKIPYSFQSMVQNSVYNFLTSEILISYTNNQTIKFFYEELTKYHDKLSKSHKKTFTHYKRAIVAAYLTISVGRILFDPSVKSFSPTGLFRVANNALRPPKTKA